MFGNYIAEMQMGLFNEVQKLFCMKCINLNYPDTTGDKG